MALLAVVIAATAAAIVLAGQDGDTAPSSSRAKGPGAPSAPAASTPVPTREARIVRRRYGRGPRSVAVVGPEAEGPLPAVLFLHGWGYVDGRDYRAWIRHLAGEGNVVIVPRYQQDATSDPAGVRSAMLAGVRRALRHVEVAPGSLVAAGHSAGGALAADYAAVAADAGLPSPEAVFVVYPGRAIIGTPGIPQADLGQIPAATRLVVLAGAADAVVGTEPARATVRAAPQARSRLLVVRDPRAADHLAPLRADPAARRVFWRRLDRLIARGR